MLRDQDNLDFLNVALECEICDSHKHSKFDCPRLHYVPLKQMVWLRYKSICDRGEKRLQVPRRRLRFGSRHPNNLFRRYENLREITIEMIDIRSHELEQKTGMINLTSMDEKSIGFCKFELYNEGLGQLDKMYLWRNYFPRFNVRMHD